MSGLVVRVEDVGEGHVAPYAELSRAVYGDVPVADPAHLRWKFLANPQGPATGIHLLRDGALVGRLVAQPRLFDGPAGTARAAYMVDLVVHPAHRGMAALLPLLGGLKQLRASFELVIATPNAAGMQIWEKFVKLPARFDLGVHVVPLRPARLGTRVVERAARLASAAPPADAVWRGLLRGAAHAPRPGAIRLDTAWPADAELDALLATATPGGPAAGRRDRAFVDWRFRRSPVFRYDVAFVRKRGRLAGYVASRRTVYDGFDTRFVVDALGRPELSGSDWSAVAWELARRELAREGAELLMILGNTGCGALGALARFPFVAVPPSRLPQPATTFADWWAPPRFALAPESMVLTLADCDMI